MLCALLLEAALCVHAAVYLVPPHLHATSTACAAVRRGRLRPREATSSAWRPMRHRLLPRCCGRLQEVVVRARHPHPLDARDLYCLAAAAARLRFLDISQSDIGDEGLRPLEGLTELTKVRPGSWVGKGLEQARWQKGMCGGWRHARGSYVSAGLGWRSWGQGALQMLPFPHASLEGAPDVPPLASHPLRRCKRGMLAHPPPSTP